MKNIYKVNEEAVKKIAERVYDNGSTVINRNDLEEMFPELKKESEDERIRKALIEMVHDTTGDELWVDYNVHKEEALAWLEKQGSEPNWCHHKVDLSNCSEEYRKAYYDGWNNCNQQHSQLKAEQTPAWSEEDEHGFENCLYAIKETFKEIDNPHRVGTVNWLKSLKDRVQSQPKREWSEEDEANLDYFIDFCNGYYNGNKPVLTESTARSLSTWLYRLKSCEIMLNTNKIDNEEAEKTIHLACEFIRHRMESNGNIGGVDYAELIKRLKSLRPQPQWKPSDEQMDALESAIVDSISSIQKHSLESLYNELKKLF